jgi:hypothetical protein
MDSVGLSWNIIGTSLGHHWDIIGTSLEQTRDRYGINIGGARRKEKGRRRKENVII